ncbi:MAG: alpha/beta fold hydrolase [Candidatus Nanosalina sp.]
MEFSLSRVGEENMHYYESDAESRIQLVFVPGGLNPEIWTQQLRYFSKSFRTASFRPTVSFRDYEGEKAALENILDQKHMENVVLISHVLGNSLVQEFEEREEVISTVLTSPRRRFEKIPKRKIFDTFLRISDLRPKIAKKMFFGEKTEYRIVKEFMGKLERPDYMDLRTFLENYSVSRPKKESLVIHPEQDRFSSKEFAQELKPNASISTVKGSGTFCFYEKPQEYNKALIDFLNAIKDKVETEEIIEVKKRNHSLLEYEKSTKNLQKETRKVEI